MRWLLRSILPRMGSKAIMTIGGALFVLDMLIPDPLPLVDEFLILAGTILLSRWARKSETSPGDRAPRTGEPKPVGRGRTTP